MNEYCCKFCEKSFTSKQMLGGHSKWCKKNPSYIDNLQQLADARELAKTNLAHSIQVECATCGKILSKTGLNFHLWRVHGEGKQHNPNKGFEGDDRKAWNKGLTKETSSSVSKGAQSLSENIKSGKSQSGFKGKTHKLETRQKIASKAGYRPGSGRGKQGWCRGIWCDSTWEAAWVVWAFDNGVQFSKNKRMFKYHWENKERKYLPDFELSDCFIEIKGWILPQDHAKWQSNLDKPLKILTKQEMKPILEWAYEKYGKDLTKLYIDNQ